MVKTEHGTEKNRNIREPVSYTHLDVYKRQAVGLAYAAVLICPWIPDVAVQVVDVVGLFLPYPQKLVHRRLKGSASQCDDGKFPGKVVAVHDAEALDGVGRGAVLPYRTHVIVCIPDAVF